MRSARAGALLFAALLPIACAVSPRSEYVLSRLYFGLSRQPAGDVAPSEFDAFLDTCISPRFPDGLTRYDTEGRWRDAGGDPVRENSVVVELIHSGSDADRRKIKEIVESYKRRFAQKSVLVVEEHPKVEF